MRKLAILAAFIAGLLVASTVSTEARCIQSPQPASCEQNGWVYVHLSLTHENWTALQAWGRSHGFRAGECWWNANPEAGGVPKTSKSTKQTAYVRVRRGVLYVVDMPAWTGGLGHYQTFGPFY